MLLHHLEPPPTWLPSRSRLYEQTIAECKHPEYCGLAKAHIQLKTCERNTNAKFGNLVVIEVWLLGDIKVKLVH